MKILGSIVGWFMMVAMVVIAIGFVMLLPGFSRVQDFGQQAAHITRTVLWLLPVLALASGGLLFWSRRGWSRLISTRLYWSLAGVTLCVWCVALWYLQSHPVRRLPTREEITKAIDESERSQPSTGGNAR